MAVELVFDDRPRAVLALNDSWLMIKRSCLHIIRNTDQLLGTFFQPIMFLVLFSLVFGGAISRALPAGVSYLNFLMAGIIVQTAAFGSTTTATSVCNDLQKGIIDRFRSLPMANLAGLNGHVISDLLRNLISTLVMLAAGLVIGFRSGASVVDWLLIAGLIVLFTLALSWLAAILGGMAKSVEGVQWLGFFLVFPFSVASAALVRSEGMNPFPKVFALNQPITKVIEAIRALMLGKPLGNYGWLSVAWSLGIMVVAIPLASWLFSRRTSN